MREDRAIPKSRRGNGYLVTLVVSLAISSLFVIVILSLESHAKTQRESMYTGNEALTNHRLWQEGDQWIYSLTGEVDQSDGTQVTTITDGALVVTVNKITTQGNSRYAKINYETTLVAYNGTRHVKSEVTQTFLQNPTTYATYVVSDTNGAENALRTVTGPLQVDMPGQYPPSGKSDTLVTFDNGDTIHRVAYVAGSDSVTTPMSQSITTPAATFSGWNYHTEATHHKAQSNSDFTTTFDGIYVPGIGNFATMDTTHTGSNGVTVKLHEVLNQLDIH